MTNDDILWKRVEELKQTQARPGKKVPSPANSGEKPKRQTPSGITLASKPASKQANRQTNEGAGRSAELIEEVRKVVKHVGKEVSFVRLTPEEKRRLVDVVYSFKRQGVKTSENELLRIALNSLLEDYEQAGKESVLARVIDALNA